MRASQSEPSPCVNSAVRRFLNLGAFLGCIFCFCVNSYISHIPVILFTPFIALTLG